MDMSVEILGYVAAVVEIIMGVPQAWQSFRQRKDDAALAGVSLPGTTLMLAHALIWCIYAVLIGNAPIFLAHIVSVPVFAATVYFVLRSRLRSKAFLAKTK